ncbi:MAG: hypothetical protein K2Y71_29930 [Xanthobacteraceae bacterium]|nr:hypothetical protein [Xanthobacteraceae bacterium]
MSKVGFPARRNADGLWAITAYFNPIRYRRKHANYRIFRHHLGLPLIAVELAYGPDFELADDDAEILIRRRGGDVLWQKERLLNLALQALPDDCSKVVWVDCDVVFESADWAERTCALLDSAKLVQPFSHLQRMPPGWSPGQEAASEPDLLRSVPFLIASGMPPATCLGTPASQIRCSPGYVWAANRRLLQDNKLYDACIVGGADSAIARAAYGRFEDALRLQHLARGHYLAWAEPFHEAVKSSVAFVDVKLFHLWHGEPLNRRYRERNDALARFEFDPTADVALGEGDVWRWNSKKVEMHAFVRDYFVGRKEDG